MQGQVSLSRQRCSLVSVCVPVLRRYDLLKKLLFSLEQSTLIPDAVYVIDNGRSPNCIEMSLEGCRLPIVRVHTPEKTMGVAEAWNWFIHNVPEERIIANDDVLFSPESLQRIIETPGDFVSALAVESVSYTHLRAHE